MTIAAVGATLKRSTPLDQPDDTIILTGMVDATTWTASPLDGFGAPLAITTNDLIADFGVDRIDVPASEAAALRQQVETNHNRLVRAYFG